MRASEGDGVIDVCVNYDPEPFLYSGLGKSLQCICEFAPMLEFAPIHISTCAAVRCSFVVLQFAVLRSNAKTQKRFGPTFNVARHRELS